MSLISLKLHLISFAYWVCSLIYLFVNQSWEACVFRRSKPKKFLPLEYLSPLLLWGFKVLNCPLPVIIEPIRMLRWNHCISLLTFFVCAFFFLLFFYIFFSTFLNLSRLYGGGVLSQKTHTYTGQPCKLHKERPPAGNWTWNPLAVMRWC